MSMLLFGIIHLLGFGGCSWRDPCVEPAPPAMPVAGDSNGDGYVDISDGCHLLGSLFRGGESPVCEAAADIHPDGLVEAGDGFQIWSHLFAGVTALPTLGSGLCEIAEPEEPTCGRMGWQIEAPESTAGQTFSAKVLLRSTDLEVEAWSLSVAAQGCTVTALRTAQHIGLGFDRSELSTDGGAVSAVVLNWQTGKTLEPRDEAHALLELDLQGACGTCTLRIQDGEQGGGEPVENVISVQGRRYRAPEVEARVELCGG